MADVKLQNIDGTYSNFQGIDTISIPKQTGGYETFSTVSISDDLHVEIHSHSTRHFTPSNPSTAADADACKEDYIVSIPDSAGILEYHCFIVSDSVQGPSFTFQISLVLDSPVTMTVLDSKRVQFSYDYSNNPTLRAIFNSGLTGGELTISLGIFILYAKSSSN